jgi:hypothetical protein
MSWSFLCSGSYVRMRDVCLFTKRTIIYGPNSLNTRNTATSTKQTIIYHPNITPWTQERPRHLQIEQSSIILTDLPEHKKEHDSSGSCVRMIDDCLFCRCRGVSCVKGVRTIDDCSFCRCRGVSCVQGVKMIDDCSLCRCRGHSCVQGVLLGW